jgi:hypothetical protein
LNSHIDFGQNYLARFRPRISVLAISGILFIATLFSISVHAQGTWTPLTHGAPDSIGLMLLLSDGTVMAQSYGGTAWYKLTPDSHGSYVNGTWTTLAPMNDSRLYYASQVLTDGRVFVAGGEDGAGGAAAEVYDPTSNTWTRITNQSGVLSYSDCMSEMLPDGTVLIAPNSPSKAGETAIYDPSANSISAGPNLFRGFNQDEASWVKLPDNSILTIDPIGTNSERFIPSQNVWINDGVTPVNLWFSSDAEMGAALLLPNGKAFFLGSSGYTALYTPSGGNTEGAWSAGPILPDGYVTLDAPAAMLITGNILCALTEGPTLSAPGTGTYFYEYSTVTNSFAPSPGAPAFSSGWPAYATWMLDLPDGTVLLSRGFIDLYVYKPSGPPLAAGKPSITSITQNGDGSYHLVGTLLNGISAGAVYGDDAQMDTNRPLVRLSDSNGNVSYARTYNWSSTGVFTGSTPVTTEFAKPSDGTYSLVVVANGIASDPTNVTVTAPTGRLINISTRAQVGTGGNILIPGFVIGGSGTETLLIRADGPSLTSFGVSGILAQPSLTVTNSAGVPVASNTGWGTNPNPAQVATVAAQVGAFALPSGSADCAVIVNLLAGAYTVQVSGVNNTTGVALAEIYEVSSSGTRLVNISTRAQVGSGANIIIPGFVISGNSTEKLLVRADGPSLAKFGVTGLLAQPSLSLFDSAGTVVASNTGWGTNSNPALVSDTAKSVGAFALTPGSADSAMIVDLSAGAYTMQLSGVDNTDGVALAEIYEVP